MLGEFKSDQLSVESETRKNFLCGKSESSLIT